MQTATHRFIRWLFGLTLITRYLVIALLFHVGLVILLGTIRIAIPALTSLVPRELTIEDPAPVTTPPDPWLPIRETDHPQVNLGAAGLLPDGPGGGGPSSLGLPTATTVGSATPLPNYEPSPVIGPVTDESGAEVRPPSRAPGTLTATPGPGLSNGLASAGNTVGPGGRFTGRFDPDLRRKLIQDNYGDPATEASVVAGLRWLRATQKPDGSWDGPNPAVTGFAVLAFLGHGETADSAEFGHTVSSGLHYLQTAVPANGNLGNMYHQGIVGIALAEGLELTGAPVLREPLERVIKVIVEAQKTPKTAAVHRWGWRYTAAYDTSDLSVSGWQIMALKSARQAGIPIPDEVFEHAAEYVWNQYGGGGFGYSGPGATANMTGVGVLCEIFLGHGQDQRLDKALDLLNGVKIDWDSGGQGYYLYGWYYATLSLFQGSALRHGGHWPAWSKQFQYALTHAQAEDGHWELPGRAPEAGQGKPYCTSLSTLMLEVYYRYSLVYSETGRTRRSGPPNPNTGGPLPTSTVNELRPLPS